MATGKISASSGSSETRTVRVAMSGEPILVRAGVRQLLGRRGFEVVDGDSPGSRVDIALYDPAAPDADTRCAALLKDSNVSRVVAYTWNFQPWAAHRLFDQGVSGYLAKGVTAEELARALRRVHVGGRVLAPTAHRARTGGWTGSRFGLTEREAELLSLIAAGHSNVEVAEEMCVSVNSVKSYIRAAYRKLDIDTRSQAVLWALRHGMDQHQGAAQRSSDHHR